MKDIVQRYCLERKEGSLIATLNSNRLDRRSLFLQLFSLEVRNQAIDKGLELAVHDFGELVQGESDAVIGYSILREVVRADLFATVA